MRSPARKRLCVSPSYSYVNADGETITELNNIKACHAMNNAGYVAGNIDENGKSLGRPAHWGNRFDVKSAYQCEWCNLASQNARIHTH